MTNRQGEREFGLDRGKIFPAAHAKSLLNPARRLVQSPRRTVGAIAMKPGVNVLEIGCGPGFFTPSLLHATTGSVFHFDLQMEMLTIARDRVQRSPRAFAVQGDGSVLPFPSACLDSVFIATVLGEIPDRDACVREVRRVLRSSGTFAVAETRRDSDFIGLTDLQSLMGRHGLEFAGCRGFRWQYVARFRSA